MASVFTSIINGDIPGRFVWRDDRVVAFLTIAPLKPGHTLVVPIEEVEDWTELDPDLLNHLTHVAQIIGKAIDTAFQPTKVALIIAGLEVPHVHLHVSPIDIVSDLDFANADPNASAESLDEAADRIRAALSEMGHEAAT
jgi:diadenosine tetraphosphate (Ap4A) HIT family hydrolase